MQSVTVISARKRYAGRVRHPAIKDSNGNVLTPAWTERHPPPGKSFRSWAREAFRRPALTGAVVLSPKLARIVGGHA